jgi:hypothetical protein
MYKQLIIVPHLLTKITRDRLAEHLTRLYLDTLTPRLGRVDFNINVSYQSIELFRYEEEYMHLLFPASNGLKGEMKNDLKEILDKSGMYDLEVEFNPSSEANIDINNRRITLPDGTDILSSTRSSDPSFRRWFQQACSLLGSQVHLIPDTNVTRRMYYTNYLRNLLVEDPDRITIALSRLEILEVESMYNRAIKKEAEKDIRIAFQSMGEILSMKKDGAKVLPVSDLSLVSSFSQQAGKGNADAWIRKEISSSKSDLVGSKRISGGELKTSNIAFLTCDLMNSLAANAEALNVIYFYRLEDSVTSGQTIDHHRLSWLIFNTAIHFGECDIIVQGRGIEQRYRCKGIWSGKSVYEWQNNYIEVEGAS